MTKLEASTDVKGVALNDGLGDCQHEFEETYYGDKCKKCGTFYADGNAPWDFVCRHGNHIADEPCIRCWLACDA